MRRFVYVWMIVWIVLGHVTTGLSATPEQIEKAIERGKAYLYSTQRDGIWDSYPPRGKINWPMQEGGRTCLAVYALLACGEKPTDPRLTKAIEFVIDFETDKTYVLGVKALVLGRLPQTDRVKKALRETTRKLLSGFSSNAQTIGLMSYSIQGGQGEVPHPSPTNYGILGLWVAANNGIEIPKRVWDVIDQSWRFHQNDDGGWSYHTNRAITAAAQRLRSTGTMTTAGLASLIIAQDLRAIEYSKGYLADENIERAVRWLATDYNTRIQISNSDGIGTLYALYNLERIGRAGGYTRIGSVDWYSDGVNRILSAQGKDGGWHNLMPVGSSVPDTAFAILFLSYGKIPVVLNKLEYTQSPQDPVPGPWNRYPRDAANLVLWMEKNMERELRWQRVTLDDPVDLLSQAPIVYIAGNRPLSFSQEHKDKLRQFVLRGGLILGIADQSNEGFSRSFISIMTELFPPYEFRTIESSHPIFQHQQFRSSTWKRPIQLSGLSNGSREFALLIRVGDLGRAWSFRQQSTRPEAFEFMANLYLYSIDQNHPPLYTRSRWITPDPSITPKRVVNITRIRYNGNWDPEPAGWQRLSAWMHNQDQTELILGVDSLDSPDFANSSLAHITGSSAFVLTDEERAGLRRFFENGGTLLADATSGSESFINSLTEELLRIFPTAGEQLLKPVSPDDPIFKEWKTPLSSLNVRPWVSKQDPTAATPRLFTVRKDDQVRVVFSHLDISSGLIGRHFDGIYGFAPEASMTLMRQLLQKYSVSRPTSQPATQTAK
ncbi:MAG: hypothetical protein KatS3mg104_0032 [Phycisphaerae bacterium]|mgnify:CR=1 FL=1|nr:MAG: hypothetical protein KatS3mg104_0032 [Phycisphaerae bacterium]